MVLTLLISGALHATAETIVLHQFSSETPDPELEDILYLAAGAELVDWNMTSIREGDDADYKLRTTYSTEERFITVTHTLLQAKAPQQPIGSHSYSLYFDYDMNVRITDEIRTLLEQSSPEIAPDQDESAHIEGLLTPPPSESPRSERERKSVLERVPSSGATTPADTKSGFRVAGRSSVLLFFGEMTEYFHYGALGGVSAGYRLANSGWLSMGLDIEVARVINDAGTVGGPLYIPMTGASLTYGTNPARGAAVSALITGGAALLFIPGPDAWLAKSVPYARAGVEAGLPIGERLSLGISLGSYLFLDPQLLLPAGFLGLTLSKEN